MPGQTRSLGAVYPSSYTPVSGLSSWRGSSDRLNATVGRDTTSLAMIAVAENKKPLATNSTLEGLLAFPSH